MTSRKPLTIAKTFVIIAPLLFLFFINCTAAAPIEDWNLTFGGENNDNAVYITQTPDEGYIIAVSTNITNYSFTGGGFGDAVLLKTDANGHEQWNRTYEGKTIFKISTTPDGGYILRGLKNLDFWVMKTDAGGQEQWNRTISLKKNLLVFHIENTSDGGSIILGGEYEELAPPRIAWNAKLIKVDASGNEQWNVTSKRMQDYLATWVQQTSDGGFIMAGMTGPSEGSPLIDWIFDQGNIDALVIKTDANGNQEWKKTFGWWGEVEGAASVIQTKDGGYIIKGNKGGSRWSSGGGNNHDWLIKTDASGNEQWNRDLGGSEMVFGPIIQTSDGGYIFQGTSRTDDNEIYDWLMKTDIKGNQEWKKELGRGKNEGIFSIQETQEHGYILSGFTELFGSENRDAWIVKIKDTNTSVPESVTAGGSDRKSAAGFGILGVMISIAILLLIKRKN